MKRDGNMIDSKMSRRTLLAMTGTGTAILSLGATGFRPVMGQTPSAIDLPLIEHLVIDLAGEPASIDPALAYAPRDWSIVHALYDAPVTFTDDGKIMPLAAKSFEQVDPLTWEVQLLEGMTFHDGSPVTSAAMSRSVAHMMESGSEASSLFAGITEVQEVDELVCRIVTSEPSPWLPAQIAVYLVLIPESLTLEQAISNPIGSGPYRFESVEAGSSITLVRNPDWISSGAKGVQIAERVTYRYVPEATTRIADLSTDVSQIATELSFDQQQAVTDAGATPLEVSVVGSHFIRIATDVEPFDRVEVRQALNFAIDVETIAQSLVSPAAHRLAGIFPDARSIAFAPELAPYAYDPDRARQLLADAGVENVAVELEITTGARSDVAEAIAAQLGEAGFQVTVKTSDYATFNATWKDSAAPALRLVSWAPLFDPQSLLGLVFASQGYLSRYANPEADALMLAASVEPDLTIRTETYRQLAQVMYDDPAAIYLWNLTSGYGVGESASAWTPRGDDYVLPLAQGETTA